MDLQQARVLIFLAARDGAPAVNSTNAKAALGSKGTVAGLEALLPGLQGAGWVELRRQVKKYCPGPSAAAASGLDAVRRRILDNCLKAPCSPSKAASGVRLSAADRARLLSDMAEQGLLRPDEVRLSLSLTDAGRKALVHDWVPPASNRQRLGLGQVRTLLELVRGSLSEPLAPQQAVSGLEPGMYQGQTDQRTAAAQAAGGLGVADVLETIIELDRELGLANRVPIFHLRQRLASLQRAELDRLLFDLMSQGRIWMSTLQEGHLYTREQFEAGIPSAVGGPKFFIIVQPQGASAERPA